MLDMLVVAAELFRAAEMSRATDAVSRKDPAAVDAA
jgi:hypothetical protein